MFWWMIYNRVSEVQLIKKFLGSYDMNDNDMHEVYVDK